MPLRAALFQPRSSLRTVDTAAPWAGEATAGRNEGKGPTLRHSGNGCRVSRECPLPPLQPGRPCSRSEEASFPLPRPPALSSRML